MYQLIADGAHFDCGVEADIHHDLELKKCASSLCLPLSVTHLTAEHTFSHGAQRH